MGHIRRCEVLEKRKAEQGRGLGAQGKGASLNHWVGRADPLRRCHPSKEHEETRESPAGSWAGAVLPRLGPKAGGACQAAEVQPVGKEARKPAEGTAQGGTTAINCVFLMLCF